MTDWRLLSPSINKEMPLREGLRLNYTKPRGQDVSLVQRNGRRESCVLSRSNPHNCPFLGAVVRWVRLAWRLRGRGTSQFPQFSPRGHTRGFHIGDARSFLGLASKIPPLASM